MHPKTTRSSRAMPSRLAAHVLLLPLLAVLSACAAGGTGATQAPEPAAATEQPAGTWTVRTREHVDLWLHGYGMLQRDTARVPLFRRGYRDDMLGLRRQRNVSTQLDANSATLQARLAANPALVNGQFLPLYFGSWQDMRTVVDAVVRTGGDPRQAQDQQMAGFINFVGSMFPTVADREWLRLFVASLEDERARFYGAYWTGEQRARADVIRAVDTLFRQRHLPALRRYLMNTQQEAGEMILSLPLGGEGRTVAAGKRNNLVAVGFPEAVNRAPEAIYVFAHEVINTVASVAVTDHLTPAEQREGAGERISATATVRGGAMLLEHVAPQLVPDYMRYYLRTAGVTVSASGDPRTTFVNTFPLPDAIRQAIARQLDVVLGGI